MAWAYNAEMICDDCSRTIRDELDGDGIPDEGDTDGYPQFSQSDEADCPQHCGCCGEFLHNDLTDTGREYVAGLIREHHELGRGDADVLRLWAEFYDIPFDQESGENDD